MIPADRTRYLVLAVGTAPFSKVPRGETYPENHADLVDPSVASEDASDGLIDFFRGPRIEP